MILAEQPRENEGLYHVIARGINAADYGPPQKRYRTIILGIAIRYGTNWSFPEPTHCQEALVWSKYIARDYWARHKTRRISEPSSNAEWQLLQRMHDEEKKPQGRTWRTVRDADADLPPTSKRREPLQGHWQHPGARTYQKHTGSDWDEPAKALKAGDHGVPGSENLVCNRRGTPRYFTIREMARLQCLPDSYVITGSWRGATRQLGNAVPVVIGGHFGRKILEIIK